MTAVNGIPYWYFHKHGGDFEGRVVESVDPGGRQWKEFGPERAIGCVVYPATEVVEPGVIKHVYGDKLQTWASRTASCSDRIVKLSEALTAGGLRRTRA